MEYALQFLGGEYVYGGTDPNSGVDCSGFTRYVLSKAASIDLPHSSSGQARFGEVVSEEEMQPGDLLFYGAGGGINHVAMYIGDGRVVHASTEKTGIKTSPYDYREPVKIISLLSSSTMKRDHRKNKTVQCGCAVFFISQETPSEASCDIKSPTGRIALRQIGILSLKRFFLF